MVVGRATVYSVGLVTQASRVSCRGIRCHFSQRESRSHAGEATVDFEDAGFHIPSTQFAFRNIVLLWPNLLLCELNDGPISFHQQDYMSFLTPDIRLRRLFYFWRFAKRILYVNYETAQQPKQNTAATLASRSSWKRCNAALILYLRRKFIISA